MTSQEQKYTYFGRERIPLEQKVNEIIVGLSPEAAKSRGITVLKQVGATSCVIEEPTGAEVTTLQNSDIRVYPHFRLDT